MAIQRLRGSKLVLKIDNTDYAAEISEWKFPKEETKDAGTKTFGDVMRGSARPPWKSLSSSPRAPKPCS